MTTTLAIIGAAAVAVRLMKIIEALDAPKTDRRKRV